MSNPYGMKVQPATGSTSGSSPGLDQRLRDLSSAQLAALDRVEQGKARGDDLAQVRLLAHYAGHQDAQRARAALQGVADGRQADQDRAEPVDRDRDDRAARRRRIKSKMREEG